jgi:hypothetical protein
MASPKSTFGIQVFSSVPACDGGLALKSDMKSLMDGCPKSSWDESADPTVDDDKSEVVIQVQWWVRTDTAPSRLFLRQLSFPDTTVSQQALAPDSTVAKKTVAYTLAESNRIVLANAATAAFTVTIPPAVGSPGRPCIVTSTNSATNSVTPAAAGGQTVFGSSTLALSYQDATERIDSDGTSWFLV